MTHKSDPQFNNQNNLKLNHTNAGELLVIEEFCRYGNLRDYLLANRQHYVNELDRCTSDLEPSTSSQIKEEGYIKVIIY